MLKFINITKVITLFAVIFITDCWAEPPLILSTCDGPPISNSDGSGFSDLILKEAFNRAGREIETIQLPGERSLFNANEGITDGDFVRISGLKSIYVNLIQVPEKITDFEFVVFTKNIYTPIKGWENLQPYHVGIVRGWKILESNILDTASLIRVKNQDLLFKLLVNNRADLIIYSRFEGYSLIDKKKIKGIRVLEPPIATREMFLYLNKKHALLVPIIDRYLKEMKKDGTFAKIKKVALSPYLPGNLK